MSTATSTAWQSLSLESADLSCISITVLQYTNYISLLQALPNAVIFQPCNSFEVKKALTYFIQSEDGAVEITTFMLLIISIFISIFTLVKIKKKLKTKKEFFFLFIFLIGLIYFAGEEVSWGQHYFHWDTSNFFFII